MRGEHARTPLVARWSGTVGGDPANAEGEEAPMSEDLGRGRHGPTPPRVPRATPGTSPDAASLGASAAPYASPTPEVTGPAAPYASPDLEVTGPAAFDASPVSGDSAATSDGVWAAPAWAAPAGPAAEAPAPLPRPGPAGTPSPDRQAPLSALGRPGGIPLRPLDLGDILDGTFGTIRRHPRAMIGLSALLVTVQELLAVGAEVGTGDIPTVFGVLSDRASLQPVGGIGAVLGLLLSTVVGAVLTGMVVVVVSEDIFGRRVTAGDVWRRVRPRIWALTAASLIAGLLPFVGLVLLVLPGGAVLALLSLVVPGAVLWGSLALTTPALVLEHLGPIRALRRSWRLAFRDFWRVWGIRALSVLLGWVMQSLLLVPFATLGALLAYALGARGDDQLPLVALVCVVLGSILGGIIAQPFLAGVLALLYVDRRMRAEGLDIVIQQQARASRRMGSGGERATGLPAGTVLVAGRGP